MNQKYLVAMSGGVDSSVAAYLTLHDGHACMGATMRLVRNEVLPEDRESSCCSLDDVEDARNVAHRLGIPFYVFNFTTEFSEQVMDRFARTYEAGDTPNPCIDCNRYLKFGKFLHRAMELDCSHIVTGHYARIRYDLESGRYLLLKAKDSAKDQSYFLYALSQDQLSHISFPLGELTKDEVRSIAQEQGFINARKRDSQDICFVPDGDYTAFLQRYTGKIYPEGKFLDSKGNQVGTHKGAISYTIGQRKGLGLAMGEPVYVCSKNMAANTVTVGPNEALFSRTLIADDFLFFPFDDLTTPLRIKAKTRSRQTEQPATIYPVGDGRYRVEFDEPQRAITTGQAVVLYDGDLVVGGGTIRQVLPEQTFTIRHAGQEDLPKLLEIYEDARRYMRTNGNMHQWNNGYPSESTLLDDIAKQQLYVCTEQEEILGVFCYFQGTDPTYIRIDNGQWLNDLPYGVVHRIAVSSHKKGVASFCLEYALTQCGNLKIDTHADNYPMQNSLRKNGFLPCGTIYLENGDPRIAFQKCRYQNHNNEICTV